WRLGDRDFNDAIFQFLPDVPQPAPLPADAAVRAAPTTDPHADCDFDPGLAGWVAAQVGGVVGAGAGAGENAEAVFREGDSFNVTLHRDLTLPSTPSLLEFEFAPPAFDRTAAGRMGDAFEAALLDAAGQPLTHTVAGSDAFFNLTEGQQPAL